METGKKLALTIFFLGWLSISAAQPLHGTPEWINKLIIYELSPKSFTSPNGPETGTFNSLKERISYLKELGITGVWLSGNNWADSKHFYNIWTQYACIRPDSIDASLGSKADFKSLIKAFHQAGIKVFLDVITHGVMEYSPLVKEHPNWFKGQSWGMVDYDWFGGHKDLDEWWIKTFTDYVVDYGIDGYRLDLRMYRPDLWKTIKENAEKAGHPIIIFPEGFNYSEAYTENTADFYQRITRLAAQEGGLMPNMKLTDNVAAYYQEFPSPEDLLKIKKVEVTYTDGSIATSDCQEPNCMLSFRTSKKQIKIKGLTPQKSIQEIRAYPAFYPSHTITLGSKLAHYVFPLALTGVSAITVDRSSFIPDSIYHSCILSCHDEGWEGFNPSENPYVAEGSRCVFGYSFLFTPAIPIFMSGEEFNADYRPLPMLSSHLFDKKNIGKGKWLYGSWIDWNQLSVPKHADMLADVKKMIAIRKQESDLFRPTPTYTQPPVVAVSYKASDSIPVPYMLWNKNKAILIAGNHTKKNVSVTVKIPLKEIGMDYSDKFKITDLWNRQTIYLKKEETQTFQFSIKKDKAINGGIAVYKIENVLE